jgi:hypothetical protein
MRRELVVAFLLFSLATIALGSTLSTAGSAENYPAYAKVGAYAFYSGNGGFIAYMSGVSANITYTVTNVFTNNTMSLAVNANLSLGTEVTTTPSIVSENLTDSVFNPRVFPALPPQDLNGSRIVFQNISCTFVGNSILPVPAGKFNATEFQGKDANGTVLEFWFDRSTGLALQEVEAASYFQLIKSNIATPVSTPSAIQTESPFIIVFIVGWTGAGLLFYGVYRYYNKKAAKQQQKIVAGPNRRNLQ